MEEEEKGSQFWRLVEEKKSLRWRLVEGIFWRKICEL